MVKTSKTTTLLSDPQACLCTNVRMASRAIARQYDAALASTKINSIQYSILARVSKHQPIAQVRLAEQLEMERTTLYRALDILLRENLIGTSDEKDGSKTVHLTPYGKALLKKARAKWEVIHQIYLTKLGVEKFALLTEALKEIRMLDRSPA